MRRILLYSRGDEPLGELAPEDVFACTRTEEVNGEHTLEVTTSRVLQKGWRVLLSDDAGKWREYAVFGTDDLHDAGERPLGTYYCAWSLKHDLMGSRVSKMPGTQSPVAAGAALEAALSGTARWSVGTVTRTATGGASMYDMSGWDALTVLVDTWGGELDADIQVDSAGVVSRSVCLYEKQGAQAPTRRFDFGADLASVRRRMPDGPLYCRITPRGKGEETEGGGHGRKVTIADANGGKDYLENPQMVDLAKLPDGKGGWEYPTLEVENADCETPADLLAWARTVLDDHTVPQVTYEVDALQLAAEGVDATGVGLGDAVQVVDRKLGDGLRVQGRCVRMVVNELDARDVQLTLGHLSGGLAGVLAGLSAGLSSVRATVSAMNGGTMSTADYLSRLLARLNAEANATGGYTYVTEGQGLRTYDKAVSDPLAGAEASQVVELRGGNIRIANSRTSAGDWDWKTVIQSGHIAANLVTAANITAGFIGSPSGNYWNLDTGELRMAANTTVGGKTVSEIASDKAADAVDAQTQKSIFDKLTNNGQTQGIYLSNGLVYINGEYIKAGTVSADRITTGGSGSTYAKVGETHTGNSGMSLYAGTTNFMSLHSLRAVDDTTDATTGMGISALGRAVLEASVYYKAVTLCPPTGGTGENAFMNKSYPRLVLASGTDGYASLVRGSSRGLYINADGIWLKFSDTCYIGIDSSGVYVRFGKYGMRYTGSSSAEWESRIWNS